MSKRSSPAARRAELIDATARVLAARGAAGTSVRVIAAAAGVSPGLVTHHFGGVERMVEATYDRLAAQVGAALERAVAAETAPRARLEAYLDASFAPPIADPTLLATWIAFWSLAQGGGAMQASHERHYAGYRARLEELLAEVGVTAPRRRLAAVGLTALVDGLWLELCLSPGSFTADEARAIVAGYVAAL
ncbi:TetR family transcriptional regulator C-terminal domain-containing protein [Sphingomonas sp. BK235]|uniref:TetR family transcriptional regulator C-terminal domain-containing protein n=1 Tax=Sphingomonas sp. BK235 TaxID=2512131 RepID=UPI001053B8B3|nr:TetR family transcriptional regulator C-terminal domain-containing protein [Sphingomonas sp. BK235]TCP33751.1 TetR family transcriptional regulator [Sphingomonas sp. BK235]